MKRSATGTTEQKSTRRRAAAASALLLVSALAAGHAPALAQAYPVKAIRIVVPLPPGGSNDLVARMVAEKLAAAMGQPVIVDNRPGASGNIAAELVARSAPDGYTLLMANTAHVNNALLFTQLPYDPLRDFAAITVMTSVHFALVVHPSVPARTVKEFIAVAKARPGAMTYASAGNGAPHHLGMELLKSMARVDLTHVPYKGAGQFVPALLAGEVTSVIGAINSLLPHTRTGRLRLLAMAGNRRAAVLPEVPTIAEAALPGYALDNWAGLVAPARTPRAVLDALNAQVIAALREPQVQQRLIPQGIDVVVSTPEEFQELMKAHFAKWEKIVRSARIRLE